MDFDLRSHLNKHMQQDHTTTLQEGVHDLYNFKAIFMAGAPGSGKSTVRNTLFGGMGLKLVDADEVRKAYLDLGKGGDYDVYGHIVRKQRSNYAQQRLGIIMDTTAWWPQSIYETTRQLKDLGYDVAMIHVFVPLHMSMDRAQRRAELTGRHVPEQEILKRYQGLQDNIRDYANAFDDHFWFVDNTGDNPKLDLVKGQILRWLNTPPQNPVANAWIQSHKKSSDQVGIQEDHKFKKQVSAAVVVTDGDHVLLAHVTAQPHWDLPKGGIDAGESPVQAAVRELREETSLRAHPQDLKHMGRFTYSNHKDLELFEWRVKQMPPADQLYCTSKFQHVKTKQWLPEMDDFAVVTWEQAHAMTNSNLDRVLREYRTRIHSS